MSYAASTDFLALLRRTSGGMRSVEMPGLDYVVSALARMGLFAVWVAQTQPPANPTTTVWFKPQIQSWSGEGAVFLYDQNTAAFEPATPALWAAFLATAATSDYVFQNVGGTSAPVAANTTVLVIQRAAPTNTLLTLPSVNVRGGKAIRFADWSSAVVTHDILFTPFGAESIMRQGTLHAFSTADQLAGLTLQPVPEIGGWITV